MKNRLVIAILVLLTIPTLCFLAVNGVVAVTQCEANPYNGFTCPVFVAYLLPFAAVGVVTIIPCAIAWGIWLFMTIMINRAKAR